MSIVLTDPSGDLPLGITKEATLAVPDPLMFQPTDFSLAVNLKTAKAPAITIPQSILIRANEVIR